MDDMLNLVSKKCEKLTAIYKRTVKFYMFEDFSGSFLNIDENVDIYRFNNKDELMDILIKKED